MVDGRSQEAGWDIHAVGVEVGGMADSYNVGALVLVLAGKRHDWVEAFVRFLDRQQPLR